MDLVKAIKEISAAPSESRVLVALFQSGFNIAKAAQALGMNRNKVSVYAEILHEKVSVELLQQPDLPFPAEKIAELKAKHGLS